MRVTTFLALLLLLSSPVLAEEIFQPYATVIPRQSLADAENYAQQVFQLAPQDLAVFKVSSGGEFFLVLPIVDDLYARLFDLSVDEEGKLVRLDSPVMEARLGESREHKALVLCIPVSEGAPSLELCLEEPGNGKHNCWQPRYSGETGELVLDKGFIPWSN